MAYNVIEQVADNTPSLNRFTILGPSYRHTWLARDGMLAIVFKSLVGAAVLAAIPGISWLMK
jgi:hypothetical protein